MSGRSINVSAKQFLAYASQSILVRSIGTTYLRIRVGNLESFAE